MQLEYKVNTPEDAIQWYKIVFTKDCYFEFTISPIYAEDRYIFKVFRVQDNTRFCDAQAQEKISLVNGIRDYKKEEAQKKNFVYTNQVNASKGDAIYIVVKNLWGKDWGHMLDLNTCENAYKFKASKVKSVNDTMLRVRTLEGDIPSEKAFASISKKLCSPDSIMPELIVADNKNLQPENLIDTIVAAKQMDPSTVKNAKTPEQNNKKEKLASQKFMPIHCSITDEVKGYKIDCKPQITEELTGKVVELKLITKGEYEFIVDKTKNYKIECNIMGYKVFDRTGNIAKSIRGEGNDYEIKLTPFKEGENFILKNIYFHANTPVFKSESNKELEQLYRFMKDNPEAVISIEGHTNSNRFIAKDKRRIQMGGKWAFSGTAQKLSKCRANEVKEYLIKKGLDSKRIETKGWGGTRELYPDATTLEESSKNMRVEIHIIKI